MRILTPLALLVAMLALGTLLHQQKSLASELREIPRPETPDARGTTVQEICLIKRWNSPDCGEVIVKTCRKDGESLEDFKARHLTAVQEMMELCPEG